MCELTDGAVILPVTLPIDFDSDEKTIKLPITLPMCFGQDEYSIKLPITLPMKFSNGNYAIKLPITLPLKFKKVGEKIGYTFIQYKEHVELTPKQSVKKLPYKEKANGITTKVPFKEKAWFFPGLILEERVLSVVHNEITLSENVQALILVEFELLSTNMLKITWHGNSVPSFTIMKKPAVDEEYTQAGSYSWNANSATFEIGTDDYNVYLLGSSNSGSSAVYTIAGANDTLAIPNVEVLLNEKVYEIDIDYTQKYEISVDY